MEARKDPGNGQRSRKRNLKRMRRPEVTENRASRSEWCTALNAVKRLFRYILEQRHFGLFSRKGLSAVTEAKIAGDRGVSEEVDTNN